MGLLFLYLNLRSTISNLESIAQQLKISDFKTWIFCVPLASFPKKLKLHYPQFKKNPT